MRWVTVFFEFGEIVDELDRLGVVIGVEGARENHQLGIKFQLSQPVVLVGKGGDLESVQVSDKSEEQGKVKSKQTFAVSSPCWATPRKTPSFPNPWLMSFVTN